MSASATETTPSESPRGWIVGLIFAVIFALAGAGAVAASSGRADSQTEGSDHDADTDGHGDETDKVDEDPAHAEDGDG